MLDVQEDAFEICRMQASVDGAFPEPLLRHWFQAAWDLCASMVGLVYPPVDIKETITCIDNCGNFTLSHRPSSEVRIYDAYRLVMILPPSLQRSRCDPALCCMCGPITAQYTVGSIGDPCDVFSPRFVQAVARLFTYLVENRGDTEMDEMVLHKSGAFTFLAPDVEYVA